MAQLPLFDDERDLPFGGETYDASQDKDRLSNALDRVYELLSDGRERTLPEIASYANCSEAGASARIRDLRKEEFKKRYPNAGVESRRVAGGKWVYWMVKEPDKP